MGVGIDKTVAPIAQTLSKDAMYNISQLQGTAATNQKLIEAIKGGGVDKYAYQMDDKGNVKKDADGNPLYSDDFNRMYNRTWGFSAKEKQPDKEDVVAALRDQTTHQIEAKIENEATDAAEFARISLEREKLHPQIKPAENSLVIGNKIEHTSQYWDINSYATKGDNVAKIYTEGTNTDPQKGGTETLQGNYYVGGVFVSEDGSLKATVSQQPYNALDESGNALHQEGDKWLNSKGVETEPTKFVKNPESNEYVVDYNTVESAVGKFDLQGFPQKTTSRKYTQGTQQQKPAQQPQGGGNVTYNGSVYSVDDLKSAGWTDAKIQKYTTPSK